MQTVERETINLMLRIGGAFAVKLAELWIACDPENRAILENGYTHVFERYKEMVNA